MGDTKNLDGPVLTVTGTDWNTFLDQVVAVATDHSGRLTAFQPDDSFILSPNHRTFLDSVAMSKP
nr:DUF397 domain-containing protein [Thermobifida halotolerans]